MSRKGNPYDEAKRNINEFIEEVYNEKRLHSSIGYLTPTEFEMEVNFK